MFREGRLAVSRLCGRNSAWLQVSMVEQRRIYLEWGDLGSNLQVCAGRQMLLSQLPCSFLGVIGENSQVHHLHLTVCTFSEMAALPNHNLAGTSFLLHW